MRHWHRWCFTIVFLFAACWLSIWRLTPRLTGDALAGFETARAMTHLHVIASEPRPIGSRANERVRDYLAHQLRELGLEVRVVEDELPTAGRGTARFAPRNVVARLRGSGNVRSSGQAVLLAAHYDSVPEGPGAGDDGAAVAAMLEVARVLATSPPSMRDVIFLLTDGEEAGLLGARAFVRSDEWRDEPGVVFNFEARGAAGPSVMFETSRSSAWLVCHYAAVAPHPVTTSLAGEVYERMPNDTDFTIFRNAGIAGLNFAFIGADQHYHQASDDLAHLDLRSLEHHGAQALALARRFGNLPSFPQAGDVDAVYFDVLGLCVIQYPRGLALPLCVTALLLWMIALVRSGRRGCVRAFDFIPSIFAPLITACVAAVLCWALARAVPDARERGLTYVMLCAMIAIAIVAPLALFRLANRWIGTVTLSLSSALVWVVLAIAGAGLLPGGSYAPLVPAIALSIGVCVLHSKRALLRDLTWCTAVFVIVIVIVPLSFLASQALTLDAAPGIMLLPALVGWSIGPMLGAAEGSLGKAPKDRPQDKDPG